MFPLDTETRKTMQFMMLFQVAVICTVHPLPKIHGQTRLLWVVVSQSGNSLKTEMPQPL